MGINNQGQVVICRVKQFLPLILFGGQNQVTGCILLFILLYLVCITVRVLLCQAILLEHKSEYVQRARTALRSQYNNCAKAGIPLCLGKIT